MNRSTVLFLQKMDGYCIQLVDKHVDHFKSTKNGLPLHPNGRQIGRPFHQPVDRLHGPHQLVDQLMQNQFTFLDVQFDVFLISKP